MKNFWTFVFLCHAFSLCAQMDFSLEPVPAYGEATADTEDFLAHALIKNLSDQTIVIAWQRTRNDLPDNWSSYVCSNITCAPPDVSMGTFSLTAGDSTNLDCHFIPEEIPGEGQVDLRLFLVQDTSQVIVASYLGQAMVVSTQELDQTSIRVFPNPATEQIHIEGGTIGEVLLFNAQGILQRKYEGQETLVIGDLPPGIYFLKVFDRGQQAFLTFSFLRTIPK